MFLLSFHFHSLWSKMQIILSWIWLMWPRRFVHEHRSCLLLRISVSPSSPPPPPVILSLVQLGCARPGSVAWAAVGGRADSPEGAGGRFQTQDIWTSVSEDVRWDTWLPNFPPRGPSELQPAQTQWSMGGEERGEEGNSWDNRVLCCIRPRWEVCLSESLQRFSGSQYSLVLCWTQVLCWMWMRFPFTLCSCCFLGFYRNTSEVFLFVHAEFRHSNPISV